MFFYTVLFYIWWFLFLQFSVHGYLVTEWQVTCQPTLSHGSPFSATKSDIINGTTCHMGKLWLVKRCSYIDSLPSSTNHNSPYRRVVTFIVPFYVTQDLLYLTWPAAISLDQFCRFAKFACSQKMKCRLTTHHSGVTRVWKGVCPSFVEHIILKDGCA